MRVLGARRCSTGGAAQEVQYSPQGSYNKYLALLEAFIYNVLGILDVNCRSNFAYCHVFYF